MKKKPMSSSKYDKNYYLTNCGGFEEFKETFGKKLDNRIEKCIKKSKIKTDDYVLDIGCGRGEVAFALAKNGAKVVGIDYSKDAISIAKSALKKQNKKVQKNVEFKVMNAKKLEFDTETFDKILMFEVWEHVYAYEQEQILDQIYNVLKKSGKAYIHTEPSKLVNDFLYPYWMYPVSTFFVNIWNSLLSKSYAKLPHPSLLRDEIAQELHVNEPTYIDILIRLISSKFKKYKIESELEYLKQEISWKDKVFNFVTQFYPVSKYFPLNRIFANGFFIILNK